MIETITRLTPQQVFLIQGNQDFYKTLLTTLEESVSTVERIATARFTMEDARAVVSWNNDHAGSEDWLLVYFDIFVADAAQVLLKTLEEPGRNVRIVLITEHPYLIPQTIRSRVRLLLGIQSEDVVLPEYMQSKKSIMAYIKETLSTEEGDVSERRALAAQLLDMFEHQAKKDATKLRHIYRAKEMLYKANMPTKQVVEYVVTMIF